MMKTDFEMANADDPESVIHATQRSLVRGLRELFKGLQEDIKQPGLTWDQLDATLEAFGKKKPTIIVKS